MPVLSAKDRRTLTLGVASVVAIIGSSRGVPAWRRWTDEARSDAALVAQRASRAEGLVTDAGQLRDTLARRNARFLALAPMLVDGATPSAASATLAGLVSGAAATSSMRIGSVQLRPDTTATGMFTRVAVRADLVGDVFGVTALLAILERGPTLVVVRELSVTQPDAGAAADRPEALRVQLLVEALALNRNRASDAGATPRVRPAASVTP
jgi:hypothetical protein